MELKVRSYEKKHLKELHAGLAECTVLLRSNGDFPLERAGKIALFGGGARRTIKGGTGSGEVNSRFMITVEQGLEFAGFEITTKDWLDSYDNVYAEARKNFVKQVKVEAKKKHANVTMYAMGAVMPEPEHHLPLDGDGDVAVYVLPRISGEGADRKPVPGDILLSETEKRDILRLQEKYKKFLLVLNVGGPVDLSPLDSVENILLLSQLGVETGTTLADLLLGKAYPSGKLATTWSAWKDYPVIGDFGARDETRYREGIYVGYRYFDTVGRKAMFPFGFGLGYTTFRIDFSEMHLEESLVCVSCDVTNTGSHPGKEIVQLYVSVPEKKLDQPYQTLAAWQKTGELAPGEKQTVELRFAMEDLASYDEEEAQYILEQGCYIIRSGSSSADTEVCGVVSLPETVVVKQVRNCLGKPDLEDHKIERSTADTYEDTDASEVGAEEEEIPILELDTAVFKTEKVIYDQPEPMDWQIAALSDEELVDLNIGYYQAGEGISGAIGQSSSRVAGAAGETSHVLEKLGAKTLVMADGPAGLRLSPKFFKDKKGEIHGLGMSIPSSIAEFVPAPAVMLMNAMAPKPRRGQMIGEQYCTAIPIGTALAQSWNLEFARMCGDIVGEEMQKFGVDLWLAPALNIHRDIRCGRNFEYYSEDPKISGLMAAAITLGVQNHSGCGVTIKHYAANNQETNRYNSNSQVSERAMREIYLRGFGICVQEAQPAAVMTSYNLLNGTHTSEHRGLIQDILRTEFGFRGVVMTDWVIGGGTFDQTSVHRAPMAHLTAAAGSDLFMPGSKADTEDMKKGLKHKEVSSEQLAINASRVYELAKRLGGIENTEE